MLYQTENPHGGDIYGGEVMLDFSANTNPYGTPDGVIEAIKNALPEVHHYPDPYCRELVRDIAEFEGVEGRYILCGNGAAELIYAYCEAAAPRRAVMPAPTFSEYALGLERADCRVERYALSVESGFELDEAFLNYVEEKEPDVVFLCNPNNPTGRLIQPELLGKILSFCAERGTRLFLDECFLDLADGGESMKRQLEIYPQLFILKAFTKSYGMAGIRLGYGMSSDGELLAAMGRAVQPWNVSLLAQAAGRAALGERGFLQKTRELIFAERAWMKAELKRLGFWVCPSAANYLLFRGPEGLHIELKKHGIAIRNCDNYPGLTPGWYRVAVKLHEQNELLINAIEQVCGREQQWQKI